MEHARRSSARTFVVRAMLGLLPVDEGPPRPDSREKHRRTGQTIPKHAVRKGPIGRLTTDELPQLDRALRFALGIRA